MSTANELITRLANNLIAIQKQQGLDAQRIFDSLDKVSDRWGYTKTRTWHQACLVALGNPLGQNDSAVYDLHSDLPDLANVNAIDPQRVYDSLYVALPELGEEDYMTWWDATWGVIEARGNASRQSTYTQKREANRAALEGRAEQLGRLLVRYQDFYFSVNGSVALGTWRQPEPETDHDWTHTLPLPGTVAP